MVASVSGWLGGGWVAGWLGGWVVAGWVCASSEAIESRSEALHSAAYVGASLSSSSFTVFPLSISSDQAFHHARHIPAKYVLYSRDQAGCIYMVPARGHGYTAKCGYQRITLLCNLTHGIFYISESNNTKCKV